MVDEFGAHICRQAELRGDVVRIVKNWECGNRGKHAMRKLDHEGVTTENAYRRADVELLPLLESPFADVLGAGMLDRVFHGLRTS